MGSYFTRSRAWVYIAFYDEYVGKHINIAAGLSLVFIIPMYWYGIHCNRIKELNLNMKYYDWSYTDKRNRLTHNMIMEHFEVHVEQLQDLLVELNKEGAKAFNKYPAIQEEEPEVTIDELAYIDELSGFTDFIDQYLATNNFPEHIQSKIRSRVTHYSGEKTKDQIRYDLYKKQYGDR